MKGYYIFAPVEEGCIGPYSGVEKKIRNFCEVLGEKVDIELEIMPVKRQEKSKIKRVVKRWIIWEPVGYSWKYKKEYKEADFVYIRKAEHDASFIKFLKRLKENNPNIKIIYEIPTYPYEKEQKITFGNFPIYIKDRLYRRCLKRYIDRVVTFYNQKIILGIPTICIMNGYNFSNIEDKAYQLDKDSIHMIEVSTTAFWHGYDRVIEGMHLYYSQERKRRIVFHMVGPFLPEHKQLVEKYNLQENVIFHGKKSGAELDEIYKRCSLGIDVLGGHRKDYPVSSSLKSREYAEKGLPIITSSPVDYLPENYKYQMLCPYDDSPVDIEKVIEFYDNIFLNETVETVIRNIQETAKENCDFHVTLKPIADYLIGRKMSNE